jgi:YfiH family protein
MTNDLFLHFPNWEKYNEQITHFITTRKGGVSEGDFQALNIAFGVPDNPSHVLENRKIIAQHLEIPIENFVFQNQVHQNHVAMISVEDKGAGVFQKENAILNTDAMITAEPNICLMTLAADCLPMLFFDSVREVIGVCHAGWRGTVALIAQETIKAMQYHFDCRSEDILVGLAPCISAEKYPVGDEVVEIVKEVFGTEKNFLKRYPSTHQYHFDLHYTNIYQLQEFGILEKNIEILPFCTYQNSDIFFSARYAQHHQKQTGRFGAGIMLKSKDYHLSC